MEKGEREIFWLVWLSAIGLVLVAKFEPSWFMSYNVPVPIKSSLTFTDWLIIGSPAIAIWLWEIVKIIKWVVKKIIKK